MLDAALEIKAGTDTTGLIVALIVSTTSGFAFIICCREILAELMGSFAANRGLSSLKRKRDRLLDDEGGRLYVVSDSDFENYISRRKLAAKPAQSSASDHGWTSSDSVHDRTSYIAMVFLLGLVALAGFIAGLSHFA